MKLYTEEQLIESKLRRCGSTSLFNIAIIEELLRHNKETFNTKDCQFYPKIDTTSATICANCGREKFEHNL